MASPDWTQLGDFRALVSSTWDAPGLRRALAELPARLAGGDVRVLQAGRHVTFRLALEADGRVLDLVVKRFGRQSLIKEAWDGLRGSKALRTFLAADYMRRHAIGTVPPVACLEKKPNTCVRSGECATLFLWEGLERVVADYLDSITLQDIRERKLAGAGNNYVI